MNVLTPLAAARRPFALGMLRRELRRLASKHRLIEAELAHLDIRRARLLDASCVLLRDIDMLTRTRRRLLEAYISSPPPGPTAPGLASPPDASTAAGTNPRRTPCPTGCDICDKRRDQQ